jgi:hypothetical protein
LIFVTSSEKLTNNIGKAETEKVIHHIKSLAKTKLVDLPVMDNATEAAKQVRGLIEPNTRGIVILGGYDVIPSLQLNILSDKLLKEIEDDPESQSEEWDVDDFIVWSDDIYGDVEGDLLPELPVSRIPDGKNPSLILTALKAPLAKPFDKYGVRNTKRPFAIDVFEKIPFIGNQLLEISEACSPKTVKGMHLKGALYFMWDILRHLIFIMYLQTAKNLLFLVDVVTAHSLPYQKQIEKNQTWPSDREHMNNQ